MNRGYMLVNTGTLNALNLPVATMRNPKLAITVFVLLFLSMSSIVISGSLTKFHQAGDIPRSSVQAPLSKMTSLGFDCGLGTTTAVLNATGFPQAPSDTGAFENRTSCTWIGDDQLHTGSGVYDGSTEPLVSDQDETLSTICTPSASCAKIGGGFTADIVYLQNKTSTLNGFDIAVSWNPNILHAVLIDQASTYQPPPIQGTTNWGSLPGFTLTNTIDNIVGSLHILQVAFAHYGGNFTLFRIRFDVVGIGNTGLTLSNDLITDPGGIGALVVHQTVQGSFDSETFYDPLHVLNWSATFTNSTPLKVGAANHFTASVSGTGSPSFTYQWMFNGTNTTPFIAQNTSSTASVTRILPVGNSVSGNRVTLRVTDTLGHVLNVTQLLPFVPGQIQGPTTIPVNTLGTWSISWLGGVPNYTASWRLCNGKASSTAICSLPNPSVTQAGQNSTQNLGGSNPGYHFSGVYNVSAQVITSGVGPVASSATSSSFLLNVTGGTPYFTVQVNADQNATVGFPTAISATVNYATGVPANALGAAFKSSQFAYTLNYGDGTSPVTIIGGSTLSTTHTFSSAASYPLTISIRDTQTPSKVQEAAFSTIVVGTSISGSFSPSTTTPMTGQSVSFTTSFSGGAAPYTYFWDYGDGSTDTGASPSHVFSTSGNHTVTVTVTDSHGRKNTTSQVITVSQSPPPPPPPSNNSWLIYAVGGVVAAVIVALILFLRRRRMQPAPTTQPTKP